MSYEFYKIIHLTGIMMIFLAFGGLIYRNLLKDENKSLKRWGMITHGAGLFLALLGGFGLIAKLKLGFPVWIWIKILIWFGFAGLVTVANRKPDLGKPLWTVLILLGVGAAYLGVFKPF